MIDLSETEAQKTKRLECKGLIYRIKINAFLNKHNDYIYKESMIFQKRKSCKGCEYCIPILDEFKETLPVNFPMIKNIKNKNGKLYKLMITNISKDWETGFVDDYDIEFKELEEGLQK